MAALVDQEIVDVVRAYLDGMMHADGPRVRSAFHPRAAVIGHWAGGLEWTTAEEFVASCERAGPAPEGSDYFWEIETAEVTGDMALVKLTDDYFGVRYTDYLSLLHHDGAWRIVNKTFFAHGQS